MNSMKLLLLVCMIVLIIVFPIKQWYHYKYLKNQLDEKPGSKFLFLMNFRVFNEFKIFHKISSNYFISPSDAKDNEQSALIKVNNICAIIIIVDMMIIIGRIIIYNFNTL